jgi:hypothetical protein
VHVTVVPLQVPAWQVSPVVQAFPSLHVVPFAMGGFEQAPVDWLHVPAVWHWSSAVHVTVVPLQLPAWQASAVVQAFPSLQVVPSALLGFEQIPVDGLHIPAVWHWSCAVHVTVVPLQLPEWQASAVVQAFPSLQVVPSGAFPSAGHVAELPGQLSARSHCPVDGRQIVVDGKKPSAGQAAEPPVQVSATSQEPADALHTVEAGANPSTGQVALVPVQVSATSQAPADARQTVPAFPTGCWQVTAVPSHLSWVQGLPSSVQAVPLVFLVSAGQLAEVPVQVSATSHSPAAARQTVVDGARASDGQVSVVPSQVSATSQLPAAARQTVPLASAVQLPRWPARLQAPQVPVQAELQQMPLEQNPEEH